MTPTYMDTGSNPVLPSSRINHHADRNQPPQQNPPPQPPPEQSFENERRHTHLGSTSSRSRRRSLASLFSQNHSPRKSNAPQKNSSSNNQDMSRSLPSLVLHNPISDRLFSSFARLVSPISPSNSSTPNPNHKPPPPQAFVSASRTVDEWVTAVQAAKDERNGEEEEHCVSITDALPPLPQHYLPCRDELYQTARDALLKASMRAAPSSSSSSFSGTTSTSSPRQPVTAVALFGPHGVGKTMLAMELVHDLDICNNFVDGVAWIQLGPDITDEELAENLICSVDSIVANDFRESVRYCPSLDMIVSLAARVLRRVTSLVVIDDVSGPRAQHVFDLLTSALSPYCVVLYTCPCEDNFDKKSESDLLNIDIPTSEFINCVAKLPVRRLDTNGQEAMSVFRNWLTKSTSEESRDGSLKHLTDQSNIIHSCFGLPLALAMAGGFLSRFHNSWSALATALCTSENADDTIFRILRLLHVKGGARFELQLKAIGSLPHGMWVSLSALADLWGTDYRTIRTSARRLGRIAFGEYRLSDSSDESRVRFHYHVIKYCARITTEDDECEANRRLLTNLSRRKSKSGKSSNKIDYLPWWSGIVTDKYLCRRLHWHILRSDGDSPHTINELICDYQWVCHRLEKDCLLGLMTEFKQAMLAANRLGQDEEYQGVARITTVIREVARLRYEEQIEMNAVPTTVMDLLAQLESKSDVLGRLESKSECVREFLMSMVEKARRPWLKPMPKTTLSPVNSAVESISSEESDESSDSEVPYATNCLTSSASGKLISGDTLGNVFVHDPVSGKKITSWTGSSMGGSERWRGVGALATIQDYVISGHYNGLLIIRSIRSGRWEILENGQAENERYVCIGTSPDGMVAVGSHIGTIFVLKGVTGLGCKVRRIDLEGHCDMVTALYIFPDKERIASSSHDGFAAIWKLRTNGKHERISLNGHKPDFGHKENCISTFASVANGKRLLSACRGGVVSAWNSHTGECLWTRRYGYQFSQSLSLESFGTGMFAGDGGGGGAVTQMKVMNGLRVGYPYLITLGDGPRDLMILSACEGRAEVVATITTNEVVSTWWEIWHPSTRRIYIGVSQADGKVSCYELVTSLR